MGKMTLDNRATRQQLEKYMALGFCPIHLEGKVANYHWQEFRLTKSNISNYKNCNWGLRTGQLSNNCCFYVIDLDTKALLGDFWEVNTLPKHAPIVSTGKGFHIYLTWTEPVKSKRYLKLDIKGEGGYVVAPPSVHENGKQYQFLRPLESLPPLMDPTSIVLPQQTVHNDPGHLAQSSIKSKSDMAYDWDPIMFGTEEGNRNNVLVSYTGILIGKHYTEDEALAEALAWNEKNRPPLAKDEVIRTVHYLYKKYD
jgi:hypothetical protein